MTPTLDFLERNPGMLAEMVADFQQRKKIVDMAKTKEPIDANVVDNPNLRAFIPYPKLMYNHTRRVTQQVDTFDEHQQLLALGWKEQPWGGALDTGVSAGPVASSDPMSDVRMDSLEQRMLMLEQGMGDILAQLQLLTLPEKRKPGRPPNASHE